MGGPDSHGQGIGARILRKEDARFLRGAACYVGDIALLGLREVAFLRSPLAHARIRAIRKPPGAERSLFANTSLSGRFGQTSVYLASSHPIIRRWRRQGTLRW
jgi:hypothetical protein